VRERRSATSTGSAAVWEALQAEQSRGRVALRCDKLGSGVSGGRTARWRRAELVPLPPRVPATVIVRIMRVSMSLAV